MFKVYFEYLKILNDRKGDIECNKEAGNANLQQWEIPGKWPNLHNDDISETFKNVI